MKKIAAIILLAGLGLTACKKEVTQVQQVNQAFSFVQTIKPADWTTGDNGLSYDADIQAPELGDNNAAIFDHGAVLVYLSFGTDFYEALPEVFDGIAYGVLHNSGVITVDMHALDGTSLLSPTGDITAKVVLIDAQELSLHPDVNLKDLGAVKKAFGIH